MVLMIDNLSDRGVLMASLLIFSRIGASNFCHDFDGDCDQ